MPVTLENLFMKGGFTINPKELSDKIVEWIEAKQGKDIEVIEVGAVSSIADYFIIASGTSERQVAAIADNVEYEAKQMDIYPKGVEGGRDARWILLDFYDVIVHVFHEQEREFYNLERLWKDGARPTDTTEA